DNRPRRPIELPAGPSVGGGVELANVFIVMLIAALVIGLAYLLIRSRGKRREVYAGDIDISGVQEQPLITDPMSALSRPPEGWASLADELAARGDFREAVRSLYLALLSRLHRDGAIDYDPAKSNWDYFRGFRGKRDWLPPFRDLTNRFDSTYYGNIGVS